jgi:prevent-host-death family protein
MPEITEDTQSLAEFNAHASEVLKGLRKTKRPVILTVDNKAEAVIMDAETYRRLVALADLADFQEAIRESLDDVKHGRTVPAEEALEAMRAKYGIPR